MAKFVTARMKRYNFFSVVKKMFVTLSSFFSKKKEQSKCQPNNPQKFDMLLDESYRLNKILDYLSYCEWFDPFTYILICEEIKLIPNANKHVENGYSLDSLAHGNFYYLDEKGTHICTCKDMYEEYIRLRDCNALNREFVKSGFKDNTYYLCMHNTWKHLEIIKVLTEHQLARNETAMENLLGRSVAA